MLKLDHFTPLSRAVASIDRDAYAARFAVYDREHKNLLRRLATADSPVSDADIAREEQAFREAIRRIEFADEDDQATLVPKDEPAETAEPADAAPSEPRLDTVWPQVRPPRREAPDVPDWSDRDQFEPDIAVAPILRLAPPRSVARRVGERLALAVVVLALAGVGLWKVESRQAAAPEPSSVQGAAQASEPPATDDLADAKAQPPSWLSPQMFYVPPPMPSSAPPSSSAAPPRPDVRPPARRP